jgi:hypothetical protein
MRNDQYRDETIHIEKSGSQSHKDFGYATTTELSRQAVIEDIPSKNPTPEGPALI